ncbi:hypothetical protein ABT186_46255, partial [Streptomyces sp. NPDC001634]
PPCPTRQWGKDTHADGAAATGPGTIEAALRANLLPARRPRISARKVKAPISRYHSWHGQARPATPTAVERIDITVHHRTDTSPTLTEATSHATNRVRRG